MIFSHTGDYGDVVYSLMAVKHLCEEATAASGVAVPCEFYVCPDGETRSRMTEEHARSLLPLLRAQPYIGRAEWRPSPLGVRLQHATRGRHRVRAYNLADQYAHYFHLPYSEHHGAWLSLPPLAQSAGRAGVVLARSHRYRNPRFPWPEIVRRFAAQAVFVGLREEHADFCRRFKCDVPYAATGNLLELARVIAGCRLFLGNQSCPRAIAEGLKVPVCVEQAARPHWPDTHFARADAWYDVPPPEEFREE